MKRLLLMRHGKAAYPEGVPDIERPLAERGRREAALAGEWIDANIGPIDQVLCSAATRTRQTLAATAITAPTQYLEQIYEAWTGDLLAAANAADDQAQTVLMVGHAPGMPALAALLASERSDQAALAEVRSRFPTSAIAVLEFGVAWSELADGGAALIDFVVPR